MMSFSFSGGVEVLGFISPTDPLDTYPVIDPLYGIDGFRNVDLISDLDLIPNSRRRSGMVVGVSGGTEYYRLNPSPWNGDITDWSIFTTEFTGGTVSGDTVFLQGLTATTISATTYQNLPEEILKFTSINDFPSTGSTNYLYLDQTESNIYAWDTTILDYTLLNSPNPPLPPDVIPLTFSNAATVGILSNNPVYYNGPLNDGVGAILSGSTNGLISDGSSPGRIDFTYTGTSGDTILVKNQLISANPLLNKGFQNGLYIITNPGSVSSPYILTRVSDFDESSELYPLQVNVIGGSNNSLKYFIQTTTNPIIGTSNIVFSISPQQNVLYQIAFIDTSTSSALPSCVYASGTTFSTLPGNGATLTAQSVGGPLIIDGMTASTSTVTNNTFNRLLVKDQTGPLSYQNGDYVVIRPGSATTTWQLRRINNWSGAFDRYTRFFLVSNTQSPKAGKLYFTTKNVPPLTNLTIGTAPINIVEYGGIISGGTFTGNTSATCISDIFVSNIHSCSPLKINPLDEGDVYFGSTSAVTIDLSNNRLGVGTTTPTTKLDINGGTRHRGNVTMDPTTSISWTDSSAVFPTSLNNRILWTLNNDSAQLYAFQPRTDKLDFVFKVTDNVGGSQSDEFVYWVDSVNGEQDDSYPLSMGQDVIVNPTRRYALSAVTSGAGVTNFYILQSGATALTQSVLFANTSTSNIGIGTTTPTAKLEIKGVDSSSSNFGLKIQNSGGTNNLTVRNDGFTYVGDSSKNNYMWVYGLGGQFGFTNENGFPSLYLSSTWSGGKYYIANGNTGSSVFSQINTNNGNWLLGSPNTTVYNESLTDTKLKIIGVDNTSSNFGLKIQDSGSTDNFVVRNDGRVGVGITLPTQKLHVSGNTLIEGSLTANTISATTYQNLPIDVNVTGGTYSSGTATFTNNTGGTFSVTGFSTSSYGVVGISNSSGLYTYYPTFSSAMSAATSGQTIEMFADIVETSAVTVTLKNGVTINGNGHTYILNVSGGTDAFIIPSNSTSYLYNINIRLLTSTGSVIRSNQNTTLIGNGVLSSNSSGDYIVGGGVDSNLNISGFKIVAESSKNGVYLPNGSYADNLTIYSTTGIGLVVGNSARAFDCTVIASNPSSYATYVYGYLANSVIYSYGGSSSTAVKLQGSDNLVYPRGLYNCNIISLLGNGLLMEDQMDVDNTTVISYGSGKLALSFEVNAISSFTDFNNCTFKSVNGPCVDQKLRWVSFTDCYLFAGSGSCITNSFNNSTYNRVRVRGGFIEVAHNSSSSHGIILSDNTSHEISSCKFSLANASSYALKSQGASTTAKYLQCSFQGSTTPVDPNVIQGMTNNEDAYGNITI